MLDIDQDQIRADITAYVEYRTETGPLSAPELRHPIIDAVIPKADGMFLWLKLLLNDLASKFSYQEVLNALRRISGGLDALYVAILSRLKATKRLSEQRFCRHVLTWLTCSYRPLTLVEIYEALRLEYKEKGFLFTVENIQAVIEGSCSPLVAIRSGMVQLIHFSTKEFLMSKTASWPTSEDLLCFSISPGEGRRHLRQQCMKYLKDNIFNGKVQSVVAKVERGEPCQIGVSLTGINFPTTSERLLEEYPLTRFALTYPPYIEGCDE